MKIFFLTLFILFTTALSADKPKYLTQQEVEWLSHLKRDITIGITEIPNQVLQTKNKTYRGFSIDLFEIIEKKSGLHFKYIYYSTWEEVLDAAKRGEVDVLFLAQKTSSRLKYLYFTDTVFTQQNKLIVNIEQQFHSLEELKGHTVAITAGSALEEYLHFHYPKIQLLSTKNELEALQFVAEKKVDATILELVRASFYINKFNLQNLLITTDIGYDYYLNIASTKELPELSIILSKTLQNIPKSEIEALKLKWGYIQEQKLFFDTQTMIYLAIAFGIIIPFSISLFFINQRLKREMREKEKALARVTRLRDSKLNEMGEIMSMIAHQWKQPLNNLNLLHQMLQLKYKRDLLDEKTMNYFLENFKKQVHLMSQTVDDFRDFFKINEQQKEFNLKGMVENLISVTQPLYEKHEITILFHPQKGAYTLVNYQSMLFQIMINILNNAKDALLEKEHLQRKISITLQEKDTHISIEIQDNGGGIPENIIDKVFNPYFSTKEKKNGTGLGLYMAKTIIEERMNGTIRVTNKKDGALFEILLFKKAPIS